MKHVFIVNPTSGRGAANKMIPLIEEYFADNKEEFEIRVTERPKHAQEIAAEYTVNDGVCLYSAGGDGTLWEVVNGVNDGVVMSVLPCGTGNDFFRMFDASSLEMKKLLKDTIEGEVIAVDYGLCNDTNRFMNCLCIGIDADVNVRVQEVGRDSLVPKKMLYVASVMHVVRKPKVLEFMMKTNAGVEQRKGILAAIMNGRHYGGGFTPTPIASITDGLLDVCLVQPLTFTQLLPVLPKYFKGTHMDLPIVDYMKTEEIEITFDEDINVSLDGEMFRMNKISAKIVKQGLLVKIPKESYHES